MPHHKIGRHYGALFEEKLTATIEKKFKATSSLKKALAGIHTLDDARIKRYAPAHAQVAAMKECIERHTIIKYAEERFCKLPPALAARELSAAIREEIQSLNDEWKMRGEFSFDAAALDDLATEAATMIEREHRNS